MSSVPHGGVLINKMIDLETSRTLITECHYEIELNERQLCDVECIMDGAFSPLQGFMTEMEYNSVVVDMKIAVNEEQSVIFGLPVVFDLSKQEDIENMVPGKSVLLKYNHLPIAIFNISSQYVPNKVMEAQKCYGTTSIEHPAVYMITAERGNVYCGGEILGLNKPPRDVPCRTPLEVRKDLVAYFDNLNVDKQDRDVIAFQCRNPIHKAHYELILRALKAPNVSPNAILLIHPTVGPTQHDDIPGALRYQTYVQLKKEVNNPKLFWDYLPYNMHMAGPREAIQHMIIRKNFGCTHFVIGRDMAGCKSSLSGEDFYGAFDAQQLAIQYSEELGVQPVISANIVFTEDGFMTVDEAKEKNAVIKKISGTKFRKMLRAGEDIPTWFAFESVVKLLRNPE